MPAKTLTGARRMSTAAAHIAPLLTLTYHHRHAHADLPSEVLGQRIDIPALDADARLALFSTCHALARLVLQHAPGAKRLTCKMMASRAPTLAHLLGTAWQPLALADLELTILTCEALSPPPPAAISRVVSHLRLAWCNVDALAAWQLHDAELWPHLQHIRASDCRLAQPVEDATMAQLQPIPCLQSFTWTDGLPQQDHLHPPMPLLLALAANATRLDLDLFSTSGPIVAQVLRRLQHLTHAYVGRAGDRDVLLALLQHPTLEHVTLGDFNRAPALDLSQQPCRWRTLEVKSVPAVSIVALGRLPLRNLEQLSVRPGLDAGVGGDNSAQQAYTRGLALLQQLHGAERLQLHPKSFPFDHNQLGVPNDRGLFSLPSTCSHLAPLLHLVVEAGRGIHAVFLGYNPPTQEATAPLVQHARSPFDTVAFDFPTETDDAWCAGLLRALPDCVTHINVRMEHGQITAPLSRFVQGLAHHTRRPLTVTLLTSSAWSYISPEVEAELREVAERAGAGRPGRALTLAVRHREY